MRVTPERATPGVFEVEIAVMLRFFNLEGDKKDRRCDRHAFTGKRIMFASLTHVWHGVSGVQAARGLV